MAQAINLANFCCRASLWSAAVGTNSPPSPFSSDPWINSLHPFLPLLPSWRIGHSPGFNFSYKLMESLGDQTRCHQPALEPLITASEAGWNQDNASSSMSGQYCQNVMNEDWESESTSSFHTKKQKCAPIPKQSDFELQATPQKGLWASWTLPKGSVTTPSPLRGKVYGCAQCHNCYGAVGTPSQPQAPLLPKLTCGSEVWGGLS